MTEFRGKPAPWRSELMVGGSYWTVWSADDRLVAECVRMGSPPGESDADMALITGAPKLLGEGRRLLLYLESMGMGGMAPVVAFQTAITQASGAAQEKGDVA